MTTVKKIHGLFYGNSVSLDKIYQTDEHVFCEFDYLREFPEGAKGRYSVCVPRNKIHEDGLVPGDIYANIHLQWSKK